MTKALTILALLAGFLLIMFFTAAIGRSEPLGEGWYLQGPAA